jgi:two-component system cell cycle response regulator
MHAISRLVHPRRAEGAHAFQRGRTRPLRVGERASLAPRLLPGAPAPVERAPALEGAMPAGAGLAERSPAGEGAAAPSELSWTRAIVVGALKVLAVAGLLAYAAHSLLGLGGHALDNLFESWVFNGLLCAGAALCLLRGAWSAPERAAWLSLGAGLGSWAVGEIIFTLDPSQVAAGFPATSDFFWLVFYPAAFLTLGLLVRARVRHFYPSLWLDGGVGALALGAVASQFILPPILAGTGGSFASVVGDLVYPLGDLLLIGFALAVLAVTGWRPGRVLGTVALGLATGMVADCVSLYLSATGHTGSSVFDSLWPASAVILGFAAWQPARPSAVIGLHGRRLLFFPTAFALVALGLLVLQEPRPLHASAYVLAVATIAGVIVRMGLTFAENLHLVERSRHEALTDPLTGLGNRRSLLLALEDVVQSASERTPWVLLLFDLNGFKRYNDSFGHPVGDALLARLGAKLAHGVDPAGRAFRLGGDEFCVLARLAGHSAESVSRAGALALTERGEGFEITTAYGSVMLPAEAQDSASALRLADRRLYANKRSGRPSDTAEQLSSVLMQVMAERQPDLSEHLNGVAEMAKAVGRRMGLSGEELEIVVRAAELHDVGKVAVPEAILEKPAGLERDERAIVERHCEVGERILAAAPAMAPVARLVRMSHERFDGGGYPDRRRGNNIALGARIIAVCDAFDAMTNDRPYRSALAPPAALDELRRSAGTQFDPDVVEVFCAALADGSLDAHRRPGESSNAGRA